MKHVKNKNKETIIASVTLTTCFGTWDFWEELSVRIFEMNGLEGPVEGNLGAEL